MIEKQFSMQALLEKVTRVEELLIMVVKRQNDAPASESYLTLSEAADLLCKSVHTLYGMVSRREIPHYKRGNRLYFKHSELEAWLDHGQRTPIVTGKESVSFRNQLKSTI